MTVANKKQNNIAKITTIQQLVKRRIWGRLLNRLIGKGWQKYERRGRSSPLPLVSYLKLDNEGDGTLGIPRN